jgi:hypothetical protein
VVPVTVMVPVSGFRFPVPFPASLLLQLPHPPCSLQASCIYIRKQLKVAGSL